MSDTRVRVPLNGKSILLEQLDAELGGYGLCASDEEVVAVEGSPVTAGELQAAVDAHVPSVVTDADSELAAAIAAANTIGDLKKALLGNLGRQARVAGRPT